MHCALCETRAATLRATHEGIALPFCSKSCSEAFCRVLRIGPKRALETSSDDKDEKHARTATDELEGIAEAMQYTMLGEAELSGWDKLPPELKLFILGRLPLLELMRQRRVSYDVKSIISDNALWKPLYRRIVVERFGASEQTLVMPTWRQQLLAHLQMRDFLIVDPTTKRIVRYMPLRNAMMPALIFEKGPSDERVLFHRGDLLMTLIQRLCGEHSPHRIVQLTTRLNERISHFALPLELNAPDRYEIDPEGYNTENPISFGPARPAVQITKAMVPFDSRLWRSDVELKRTDPTSHASLEVTLVEDPLRAWHVELTNDSELLVPGRTLRTTLYRAILKLIQDLVIRYDPAHIERMYGTDAIRSDAMFGYRTTAFGTRASEDECRIEVGYTSRTSSFNPIGRMISYLDQKPTHLKVPRIRRLILQIDMPTPAHFAEFHQTFRFDMLESDLWALQKQHWRDYYTTEPGKKSALPVTLTFEPVATFGAGDDYDLYVFGGIGMMNVSSEMLDEGGNIRVSTNLYDISPTRPYLRRQRDGLTVFKHEGEYTMPAAKLGWYWGDSSLSEMPDSTGTSFAPYATAIRAAVARTAGRPLTVAESQYPIVVTFNCRALGLDFGSIFHFPTSNTYCLFIDSSDRLDEIIVTSKGGADRIASKLK